jgi:hypothetical protein
LDDTCPAGTGSCPRMSGGGPKNAEIAFHSPWYNWRCPHRSIGRPAPRTRIGPSHNERFNSRFPLDATPLGGRHLMSGLSTATTRTHAERAGRDWAGLGSRHHVEHLQTSGHAHRVDGPVRSAGHIPCDPSPPRPPAPREGGGGAGVRAVLRRRGVLYVGWPHGTGLVFPSPARLSVALGSSTIS